MAECKEPERCLDIDRVKLVDLKRKIFLRSALIPIDGLSDILDLNETFSADEILGEIFTKSLKAFEFYNPLVWESRVTISQLKPSGMSGWCKICDNFDLYLKGIIDTDQIILVPNATPKIRPVTGYPELPTSYYSLNLPYRKPLLYLGDRTFTADQFCIRGLSNRPIRIDLNPDKTFSETGAIYFMDVDAGVLGQKFLDQCLCDVLDYVRNLRASLSIPNFPVDIFSQCDVAYQQLKSELDQYYLQSGWRGELLV